MSDGPRVGPSRPNATARAARGAGWLYGFRWVERLLDFVAIVVLARLLSPDDFGLVAIAASIVAIIEGLAAFDVYKALIRARDPDRALYDSAWTLGVLRGIVSAAIMVAIAPMLGDPRLGPVLCALALSPLLMGLANPLFTNFERDLAYSKVALQTLAAKLGSFLVTLAVAFATRSYWALVLGVLVNSFLITLFTYVLLPYRPRPTLARFSDIFGFSGWLSLNTAVTTLSMETDKLIVGKLLGVADTGRYFMAQRVGALPTRELISPLQRLLFPSFSELLPDPERLRRVVAESVNVVGSLSLPAGCGFALVAADFVPLALGDQWTAIVPLLMVLAPYLGARATLAMTLPAVLALGRTKLLFQVSAGYALVHIPAFVAGTFYFGLQGAIWSLVAAGVVYTWLNVWMLKTTLDISAGEIFGQLRRPLAAVALMVAAVMAVKAKVDAGAVTSLALTVTTGAGVYVAAIYGLWRLQGGPDGIERRLTQLWTQLRRRIQTRQSR